MRTTHVTDAELAAEAAAGDPDAFGHLVERYTPTARRLARALLGDPHDGDDAVQDGLFAAWRAIEQFDPARPFRPWLLRIVLNAARDLRRRRVVRQADPLPIDRASGDAPPDQVTGQALFREAVAAALDALPERQRVAVTLFDAEGYGHAEIAAVLDVPEGTVRSDVFHGRRALRRALAPFLEEGL